MADIANINKMVAQITGRQADSAPKTTRETFSGYTSSNNGRVISTPKIKIPRAVNTAQGTTNRDVFDARVRQGYTNTANARQGAEWAQKTRDFMQNQNVSDSVAQFAMQQGLAEAGQGAQAINTSNRLTGTLQKNNGGDWLSNSIAGILKNTAGSAAATIANTAGDIAQLGGASDREQRLAYLQSAILGEADPAKRLDMQQEINTLLANPGADNEIRKPEYYEAADKAAAYGQDELAKAKEQGGKVFGAITDLAAGATQLGVDALAGMATGTGIMPYVTARAFASGSQEARQAGADYGEYIGAGTANALVSYLTEQLVGAGTSKLTGVEGAVDAPIQKAISWGVDKLAKTVGGKAALNNILQSVASGLGESVEGAVEALVQPAIQRIYDDKALGQYRDPEFYGDVLYDGLIEGLVGTLFSAVQSASTTDSTRAAYQAQAQQGDTNPIQTAELQQKAFNKGKRAPQVLVQTPNHTEPVQRALKSIKETDTVSNSQAANILADDKAMSELGLTGLVGTASQQRAAVKGAIAELHEQENLANVTIDANSDAQYNNIGRRSDQATNAIQRLNAGESVSLDEIMKISEIAFADNENNSATPTIDLPNRESIRQAAYEKAIQTGSFNGTDYTGPVRQERRMDIVIGLPGSGKSSVYTERISRENGSRVIDTDDFRDYIPEYNGTNAAVVHEEASEIKDMVFNHALENGDNIILSTIGANAQKLARNIQDYRNGGYSVYLHLNELPNNKSMARAIGRYIKEDGTTSRYVSPKLIADYGDKPTETYLILTGQGGTANGNRLDGDLRTGGGQNFGDGSPLGGEVQGTAGGIADILSGWDWYNNDVEYGQPPKLIQSSEAVTQPAPKSNTFPSNDGVGAMNNPYPTEQKTSKAGTNTFAKTYQEVLAQLGEDSGLDITNLSYDPVTEAQSIRTAQQRLFTDLEGEMAELPTKEAWTGEDLDTAMGIMDRLMHEAMDSGDYTEVNRWAKIIQDKGTQAGQFIQAFAKYSRSPAGILVEVSEFLESDRVRSKVTDEKKQEIMQTVKTGLAAAEEAEGTNNEADTLISLIEDMNVKRRTTGLFAKKTNRAMHKALTAIAKMDGGTEFLRNVYRSQVVNYAGDYAKATTGSRLKTWRVNNMLSKVATLARNILSNNVFDPMEAIATNIAVPIDILVSKITGTRSVSVDKSWFSKAKRQGSRDAFLKSYVQIGLDADSESGGYEGIGGGRTFKMSGNFVERLLSTYSKWMAYGLQSTDELQKGGIRAETQRGIDKLTEQGKIKEGTLAGRADEVAKQRTFQNDSLAAGMLGAFRQGLNKKQITKDLGVGDVAVPFVTVPANVVTQAANYSPAGLANSIKNVGKVLIDAKNGKLDANAQADAVTKIGRGITGTTSVAIFTAFALKGILSVAGDDDKDREAVKKAQGVTGTQLNVSALGRWISGKDTAWRDDDYLINIGFLEPLNANMAMGAMIADAYLEDGTLSIGDIANANISSIAQSVLELPALSQIQDLYNGYKYSDAETEGGKYGDAILSFAGGQVSSFITPNFVAGIAQGTDPIVRDEYAADSTTGQILDSIKADIPGLRQTLPAKTDSFGNDMEYSENPLLRFLNSNVLPGRVTSYQSDVVTEELDKLNKSVGVSYPDKTAPKSFTVNEVKYEMSDEERQTYKDTAGQIYYDFAEAFMESEIYDTLSDQERADVISGIKEYAGAAAKKAINPEYEFDSSIAAIDDMDAEDASTFIAFKNAFNAAKNDGETDTLSMLLDLWTNASEPVQNALIDTNGFETYKDVHDANIDLEWWQMGKAAFNSAKEDAKTGNITDEDNNALLDSVRRWRGTSDKQKAVYTGTIGNGYGELMDAASEGIEPALWFEAYYKEQELNKDKSKSANDREIAFDVWLDALGLNDKQKSILDDQASFGTYLPAEPKKYDQMVEAGFTVQTSQRVYDSISALPDDATSADKYNAILNVGLSEEDTYTALKLYDSSSKKLKFATAEKYGIPSSIIVHALTYAGDPQYDADDSGALSKAEVTAICNAAGGTNQQKAVIWAMLTTAKSGNPFGNVYNKTLDWVIKES